MQLRNEGVRVGLVHTLGASDCLLARSIQAALEMPLSMSSLIELVQSLLRLPVDAVDLDAVAGVAGGHNLQAERFKSLLHGDQVNTTISKHVVFSTTVLHLRRGQSALLSNGKVGTTLALSEMLHVCVCGMCMDYMSSPFR